MSLAIKFGDTSDASSISGFIYFDAVTDYTRNITGKTTNNPIDAGALITDHFVADNKKFNIKGVITGADISGVSYSINIDGEIPNNYNTRPSSVVVSDQGEGLPQYLPAVVSQFLGIRSLSVVADNSTRTDYKDQVWNTVDKLMTGLVYDKTQRKLKNQMTVITLYELDGSKLQKQYDNLVMTGFQVDEDADSGDGMFFSMNLESVNFVTLEKVDLPQDVSKQLKKAAAPKSSKAKANSDAKPTDSKETDKPKIRKVPTVKEQLDSNNARLDQLLKK